MHQLAVRLFAAASVLVVACGSSSSDDSGVDPNGASPSEGSQDRGTGFAPVGGEAGAACGDTYNQEDCACGQPGQTQKCFVGEPAKAGLGSCSWGEQTCVSHSELGGKWGPCTGSGAPTAAACDGIDHQCNGQIDQGCSCTPKQTKSCYSGPAGTEGVGLCKGGTQTCVASKSGDGTWGPCAGQVIPGPRETTCSDASQPPTTQPPTTQPPTSKPAPVCTDPTGLPVGCPGLAGCSGGGTCPDGGACKPCAANNNATVCVPNASWGQYLYEWHCGP